MIALGNAWQPLRRAIGWTLALLLANAAGSWALDAAAVADRLLSAGPGALAILPLVLLFMAARLALYFIAPGLLIRGLALGLAARRGT
ncbi:MAG: hypothetical protein QM820_02400 [Minicystis sp.]